MLAAMADLGLLEQCTTPVVASALGDGEAEALARLLGAVAEPMRIKILHRLMSAASGVCVCDLVGPLCLTQPSVSHHLRVLLRAGLVDRRQERSFVYYSLRESAMEHLSRLLTPTRPASIA